MYIEITELITYMEFYPDLYSKYYRWLLNINNYKFFRADDIEEILNSETGNDVNKQGFLQLPQVDIYKLKKKFILMNNDMGRKFRKILEKDFEKQFHWYITDNNFIDEWSEFENQELRKAGIEWCCMNNIKYSLK